MAEENKQTDSPQQQPEQLPNLPRTEGHLFGSNSGVKRTWPELVGVTAEEAGEKIKQEKPGAQIQVVPPDSFVTMDFRQNRVRLYVDSSGKVARAPMIG
ncbi:hypothetical protein Tsubulata_002807 [Turnera subulata]|uniref:Subtilisin inhibitor domain-containing protein n=1 Tax=Turnera subulata TaxID=218843 RepID=A0A9Q0FPP9_9ROSI|nr:hypothetical protein Tsubulata_002807 [Turnera subulata]